MTILPHYWEDLIEYFIYNSLFTHVSNDILNIDQFVSIRISYRKN